MLINTSRKVSFRGIWGVSRNQARPYSEQPEKKKVAMMFGLDAGFGQGVARKFATKGYVVALLGSSKKDKEILDWTQNTIKEDTDTNGSLLIVDADVTDPASVKAAFDEVVKSAGVPEFVLYNTTGFLSRTKASDLTLQGFEDISNYDIKGAYNVATEALKLMEKEKSGTLVFGNTPASLNGRYSSSIGKFALRGYSQVIAREFGPKGVHVVHAIVDEGTKDAPLDPNFTVTEVKQNFQHNYDKDIFLDPMEVADAIYFLHGQDKNCWTNEIEFRPPTGAW